LIPVSSRRARADRKPLPPGYWTIWSTVAVDLLGFGIILPILPLFSERFGASPTTIGLLVASFSAAQFVAAPIMGRVSDRVGRKPVILVSLFGSAVGSLVLGLAGAVWMLFLGRIIDGASGASVSVAQGAITDIAEPKDRARLLGLLGAAFGVGFVLGPALGGIAAVAGPRVPFFVAAAIALVNGLVAIRRLPETHPARRPDIETAGRRLENLRRFSSGGAEEPVAGERARRQDLALLAAVAFLATAAFAGFEATFSLLGQRRFGLTEGTVAPVFVAIGLALVAVQAGLVQPVTHRLGGPTTLRAGLSCTAVGLGVLAFALTWPLLVLALALLVVGQGLTTPTLTSIVANRSRDASRGRSLGRQQSAASLARIVGPVLAGALFQHVGVWAPYAVGAGIVVVALVLLGATLGLGSRSLQVPAAAT
jgi:MFS transporter, DHA1 family, tetracycline resistance protein